MILTGNQILRSVKEQKIIITPFDNDMLNPNSYDLRLGNRLLIYTNDILDTKKANPTKEIIIPEEGLVLEGGHLYLGCSVEVVGSDYFVPIIHCKSGIARLGLFLHITADLIDIGSHGNFTFQMHPIVNIRVYPNMRIGQVSFWKPLGKITLYSGKYQGSCGPKASMSYKSFEM